jgi:hypothetical protein
MKAQNENDHSPLPKPFWQTALARFFSGLVAGMVAIGFAWEVGDKYLIALATLSAIAAPTSILIKNGMLLSDE